MDTGAILKQLNDLPGVFKPGDPTYNVIMASILTELNDLGATTDSLQAQLSFPTATAGWLDLWGDFFGIPRNASEPDATYNSRIQETLLGWASTVAGIKKYIETVYGVSVSVTENLTNGGFTITFSEPLTDTVYTEIALGLNHIRPAGVPFLPLQVISGGGFLTTDFFLGMSSAGGAYLTSPTEDFYPPIPPNTNAWRGTIPSPYFAFPNSFNT